MSVADQKISFSPCYPFHSGSIAAAALLGSIATAALLDSQSDEDAAEVDGDMNPDRAAELDRLVEAGDWEGVVAAAAAHCGAQDSAQLTPSEPSDAGASSVASVASTRTGDSGAKERAQMAK